MARDILDSEEFRDLELLGGMARHHARPEPKPSPEPEPPPTPLPPPDHEPPDHKQPGGRRINYVERPFETGPSKHSRFLGGEVQANELNPDFKKEMKGPVEAQLAYAALMIGKETIAYNDKSGTADDYLERLLSFYFRVKERVSPHLAVAGKRRPGRPRRLV